VINVFVEVNGLQIEQLSITRRVATGVCVSRDFVGDGTEYQYVVNVAHRDKMAHCTVNHIYGDGIEILLSKVFAKLGPILSPVIETRCLEPEKRKRATTKARK